VLHVQGCVVACSCCTRYSGTFSTVETNLSALDWRTCWHAVLGVTCPLMNIMQLLLMTADLYICICHVHVCAYKEAGVLPNSYIYIMNNLVILLTLSIDSVQCMPHSIIPGPWQHYLDWSGFVVSGCAQLPVRSRGRVMVTGRRRV